MKLLLVNILLAILWLILTGRFDPTNFLFGFGVSYFILWLVLRNMISSKYFEKIPKTISFTFYFFYLLFKANMRVAFDILTIKHYMHPGILAIPLKARTNIEITMLANFITLTPGTLSLDISNDRKIIYIHFMYIDNEEDARREIKDFEAKILDLIR